MFFIEKRACWSNSSKLPVCLSFKIKYTLKHIDYCLCFPLVAREWQRCTSVKSSANQMTVLVSSPMRIGRVQSSTEPPTSSCAPSGGQGRLLYTKHWDCPAMLPVHTSRHHSATTRCSAVPCVVGSPRPAKGSDGWNSFCRISMKSEKLALVDMFVCFYKDEFSFMTFPTKQVNRKYFTLDES